MLKNYFIIAWRNLWKYKTFSIINIVGLAIGIGVSMLMLVHVKQELSYESDFPKHDQIYRIASSNWAKMSPLIASELITEMPEIKQIGRLYDINPQILSNNRLQIASDHCYAADQEIMDIFDFQFVFGNSAEALKEPNSIVLVQELSNKLFGPNVNPVGERLQFNNREFVVTGVMRDLPINTHLKINCLTAISGDRSITTNDSKIWRAVSTYALINTKKEAVRVNEKLKEFQVKFLNGVMTPAEIIAQGDFYELDAIDRIHLYSDKEKELTPNSDIIFVYIFSALAVLIIFIAASNFINLFTAQTLKRLKEVGVRKVIGATRSQLVFQFFQEAFLLVSISGILALCIIYLVIPYYNNLPTVELTFQELFGFDNLLMLIAIVAITGILSGSYPVYSIIKNTESQNLKSKSLETNNRFGFRKNLLVFQFMITLIMLASTYVVYQQMIFIKDKDLGFAKEGIVAVKLYGEAFEKIVNSKESFRTELLRYPQVNSLATTSKLMGERFGYEALKLKNTPDPESIQSRFLRVDEEFFETMGIELLEGRHFQPSTDTSHTFIINETAAHLLNTDDLIGQEALNLANGYQGTIIGVVKDFNYASLHEEVEPLVIEYRPNWASYLLVNVNTVNAHQTMEFLESCIKKIVPSNLFLAHFLNERIQQLYHTEYNFFQVFKIFALLSMVITCMGLFALAAYTIETRLKEIGVRKILGASTRHIFEVLSLDFFKCVIIASLVAMPLCYYGIGYWLENFEYKMALSWWFFVLPLLIVLVVTFTTVGIQAIKAAWVNPVETLRNE